MSGQVLQAGATPAVTGQASPGASPLLWTALGVLLLVRLLMMAYMPLADSTEARYADIGRRMLMLNDWMTPWFDDGVPFWGKPPLHTWITAAGMGVWGLNGFGARFAHGLAGIFVAWVVWDWQRRERGKAQAQMAVVLLSASAGFYLLAGAVLTDMSLLAGLVLAMRGFWRAMQAPDEQARSEGWLLFIGLAIGLLAKGPIALVLAGVPILVWLIATRSLQRAWRHLPWFRGMLLMFALVLPWYLLAESKTPGFLDYFLVGEHWRRFTVPGWEGDLYGNAHFEPRGIIWVFLLKACMPWVLLLPLLAWGRSAKTGLSPAYGPINRTQENLYLWAWALWPCLFFTGSRNILWTYVLPGLPALAILGAAWLAHDTRYRRQVHLLALGLLFTASLSAAAGVGLVVKDRVKSARDVIAAFEVRRQAADELLFVGERQFSVAFYGQGRYKPLPDFEALAKRLEQADKQHGGHRYVALRRWAGAQPPADLLPRLQQVGVYQGYVLMQVVP